MAGARKKPNKKNGNYQGYYRDYTGKRVFFVGTTSRQETKQIAQQLEAEHRQMALGVKPPPTVPARHRSRPFLEVVEEYIGWGRVFGRKDGKGWSPEHADAKDKNLKKWSVTLNLETLADLDENLLPRVEAVLKELAEQGYSGNTLSRCAQALTSFCNWCLLRTYLTVNPLARLVAVDCTPRKERRALTAEEIGKLLAGVPEWCQLDYAAALCTGLRMKELRSLDLNDLDVDNCRLRLRWKEAKNRKEVYQYIPAKLAEWLAGFSRSGEPMRLYEKAGTQRVLPPSPLLFVPSHARRRLDADLKRVGIAKETSEGKLDFHALRVAFVTLGAESAANVKELQAMARHSDPRLTLGIYAKKRDPRMSELAERIGETVVLGSECATGVQSDRVPCEQGTRKLLPEQALPQKTDMDGLCQLDKGPGSFYVRQHAGVRPEYSGGFYAASRASRFRRACQADKFSGH